MDKCSTENPTDDEAFAQCLNKNSCEDLTEVKDEERFWFR